MRVEELFPQHIFPSLGKVEIKGASSHTQFLEKGDMFFIIEGKNFDIFKVLKDIEEKVSIFVAEEKHRKKINYIIKKKPVIFVKDIKKELRRVTDEIYKGVIERFKFILVTGTDGKTTTAYLIWQLLKSLNLPAIFLGTVGYYLEEERKEALLTTPDYLMLRKILRKEKDAYVVMEASSQGIEEGRVDNLSPKQLIFTNLTREHLDYHKNMENYFQAKKKLFTKNPHSLALINIDNIYGKRLFSQIGNEKFTYGESKFSDYRIKIDKVTKRGSLFRIFYKDKEEKFFSPLLGRINIENLSAALASFHLLGFSFREAKKNISKLKAPPGRLEKVREDIFVDYAHTPSALEKTLVSLRELGYKKIICVFGCGGNRDKRKRKLMGKIASLYADYSIITSDNPRDEDPYKICLEIRKGFVRDNFSIIVERKKALKEALRLMGKGWCILVAGKGHERYQTIKGKKIAFDDRKILKDLTKR